MQKTASSGGAPPPRQRIINAAAECFTRSGFHGASMQEIARAACVSAGSIYRHFPSKAAIILAIAEAEREQHAVFFEQLNQAEDPLSALADIGDHVIGAQLSGVGPLLTAEVVAEAARNPEVRDAFDRNALVCRDHIVAALRIGQARGQVDCSADLEAACHLLLALGDGLGARRSLGTAVDGSRVLGAMRTLLFRFLRPPVSLGVSS